jgi:hypothetical protein
LASWFLVWVKSKGALHHDCTPTASRHHHPSLTYAVPRFLSPYHPQHLQLIKDGFVIKKPQVVHSRSRFQARLEAKRKGRHTGRWTGRHRGEERAVCVCVRYWEQPPAVGGASPFLLSLSLRGEDKEWERPPPPSSSSQEEDEEEE